MVYESVCSVHFVERLIRNPSQHLIDFDSSADKWMMPEAHRMIRACLTSVAESQSQDCATEKVSSNSNNNCFENENDGVKDNENGEVVFGHKSSSSCSSSSGLYSARGNLVSGKDVVGQQASDWLSLSSSTLNSNELDSVDSETSEDGRRMPDDVAHKQQEGGSGRVDGETGCSCCNDVIRTTSEVNR